MASAPLATAIPRPPSSSLARIPNELRLPILTFLTSSTSPSAYAWDPHTERALRALSATDRVWRNLALPALFSRAAVRRAADIRALLACPEGLAHVESLVLLPGEVEHATGLGVSTAATDGHAYCATELAPLFAVVGARLRRLCIVHDFARRLRDCQFLPGTLAPLGRLEELVVDSPSYLLPFAVVRWQTAAQNRGMLDWVAGCPRMERLRRLATRRDKTWWREFEYAGTFPGVREMVFCERMGGGTDERDVRAMQGQMERMGDVRVGMVEERRAYEARQGEWERFGRLLPEERFVLVLEEEPNAWFVTRVMQGGLFAVWGGGRE